MKVTRELLFCGSCFKNTKHTITNFQTILGRWLGKHFLFFHDDTYYECSECWGVKTVKLTATNP